MNGGLYEESPPPAPQAAATPISSPAATVPPPAATTSATSSSSPASVASNSGSAGGPLHIPAKRLASYGDCADGVIRHGHGQPWTYSPSENHHATAFDVNHQYSGPTYYNLADPNRDARKAPLSFWSPAAATASTGTPEYKYSSVSAGPSADPAVSSCHQSFSGNTWCNYSPYSSAASRHHVDTHQAVPYLPDDRGRAAAAAAMVAESASFVHAHDRGYGLGNYAPEPVPSAPYPPPGG